MSGFLDPEDQIHGSCDARRWEIADPLIAKIPGQVEEWELRGKARKKLQAAIAGGPQPFGRSYYLQTGPASVKNEPLSENHPLTPIDGAP